MTATFSVKTDAFEGPLDLLLNLIEERKMLISDISLSGVADAFLSYISNKDEFPLRDTAQFLVVAATLLLIKSRALLPVLTLTEDEEIDIRDLERRLTLLKVMRDAARTMATLNARMHFGGGVRSTDPLFTPPPDLAPDSLLAAARGVLDNAPKRVLRDEVVVAPVVSLDEMIERLTERVQRAVSMTFREFAGGSANAHEIVIGFLAMLELVKRGFAQVSQAEHFDEIRIEYAGETKTPHYD